MRARAALLAGLTLALGAAAVVAGARVAERLSPGIDLSLARRFDPGPDARARLAALPHRVVLTWFATPAEDAPSELVGLERDVRAALGALSEASDGRLVWQVLYPERDAVALDLARRMGVSPFTTRDVRGDLALEREAWSTLHVAYGPHAPTAIRALGPRDAPRLAGLVLAHLDATESPRRPVVALDAPPGEDRDALRARLERRADVIEHTFDAWKALPDEADLFVWVDPARSAPFGAGGEDDVEAGARAAERLEAWLETGRGALLAGGALEPATSADGAPALAPIGGGDGDLAPLLAGLGLRVGPDLVLDERCVASGDVPLPFRVLCTAYDQDFRDLAGQPNGTLLFDLPQALAFDEPRLAELELVPDVLATTSDRTWTQPVPERLDLAALAPENGTAAPKLPLLARLVPRDPERGTLVVAGSSSVLRSLDEEGLAHGALLEVLLDDLLSPERLVRIATPRRTPERLPFLASPARLALRALAIGAAPALLALLWLVRRPRAARGGPRALRGLLPRAALPVLGAFALAWTASALPRLDLTEDGRNSLAPATRALAREAGRVRIRRVVSPNDRLPPALRATVRDADRLLRELPGELVVERVEPELLPPEERERLAALGAGPVEVAGRTEEARVVRRAYAALLFEPAGVETERDSAPKPVVVPLHDPDAADELEFRVALALRSLERGRPRVAFASDLPRLTAAEAWEYQRRGLLPPAGKDEYAAARERLEHAGFDVVHVNPRAPELPAELDALVWLQPRREVGPMLAETVHTLRRGGKVLLAAQTLAVEPGEGGAARTFQPRDQLPDLDLYWPDVGLRVARSLVLEPDAAEPFVARAPAEGFDRACVATRSQGDQAFVAPSRVELDAERLTANGIEARTWIATSARAWSLPWSGGALDETALAGAGAEASTGPRGPFPLVVELEGTFPPLQKSEDGNEDEAGVPGTLVFVASSATFRDERLRAPDARADRLLVDATALLALGDELATVVARRPVARGFAPLPEARRLRWRGLVVAGAPLALLVVGLFRLAAGRVAARRGARGARANVAGGRA